jgi:hypothetical protein
MLSDKLLKRIQHLTFIIQHHKWNYYGFSQQEM